MADDESSHEIPDLMFNLKATIKTPISCAVWLFVENNCWIKNDVLNSDVRRLDG